MKVVFCGTPQFAVPTLKHLLTQPDFGICGGDHATRPAPRARDACLVFPGEGGCTGRRSAGASAGKDPCHPKPRNFGADFAGLHCHHRLRADYPRPAASIAKHGWINLHASLLPKYRGAAPINWAIVKAKQKLDYHHAHRCGHGYRRDVATNRNGDQSQETTPELPRAWPNRCTADGGDTARASRRNAPSPAAEARGSELRATAKERKTAGSIGQAFGNEIYNRMRGLRRGRERTQHFAGVLPPCGGAGV